MGYGSSGEGNEFGGRDGLIKKLLLSSDGSERHTGMVLLDETFRWPVASVLVSLARQGDFPACTVLLVPESRNLDRHVFADVWSETIASVWKNVQEMKFTSNGSLLAYLVRIAWRRMIDLGRNQQTVDDGVDLRLLAAPGDENAAGLIEDIGLFYDGLSEKDHVILELGVKLAQASGSSRVSPTEVAKNYERIRRIKGWPAQPVETISRRYHRLRERLRRYLQDRGYNV